MYHSKLFLDLMFHVPFKYFINECFIILLSSVISTIQFQLKEWKIEMHPNNICGYSKKQKGSENIKSKVCHQRADGKTRCFKRGHSEEYYHSFERPWQSKERRVSDDMRRTVVERAHEDDLRKTLQSAEQGRKSPNERLTNFKEEQNCPPTNGYEQIKLELDKAKDNLEHSNNMIQELKVQNAKLKCEKKVDLENMEKAMKVKDYLKSQINELKNIESLKSKEITQNGAEIEKQKENCMKAEIESLELKVERNLNLQKSNSIQKECNDFKIQFDELKKAYDSRLEEIEENTRTALKQEENNVKIETAIQELKVENTKLKCESNVDLEKLQNMINARNNLTMQVEKLENLKAKQSEEMTEKQKEIHQLKSELALSKQELQISKDDIKAVTSECNELTKQVETINVKGSYLIQNQADNVMKLEDASKTIDKLQKDIEKIR